MSSAADPAPDGDPPPLGPPRRQRRRLSCPRCHGTVRSLRRTAWQRWLVGGSAMGSFRCANAQCGWHGLLARRRRASKGGWRHAASPWPAGHTGAWARLSGRALAPLVAATLAVLAAQWGARHAPQASVSVGARYFAPGEAFDGEALPAQHALWMPTALTLESGAGEAPDGADGVSDRPAPGANPARLGAGSRPSPPGTQATTARLSLKRFCAWGRPGRMPYQGTADEALRTAGLPPAVRQQLVAAIAAGSPSERLVIANDAIRATTSGRSFEADGFAMTYGRTLCLGTRVNFKAGHTEPASLYEAVDPNGRRFSVMVPDVCGNVSLIQESQSSKPGDPQRPWDPGRPGHPPEPDKPNEVPTPGSLALALVALAAARVALRRGPRRE